MNVSIGDGDDPVFIGEVPNEEHTTHASVAVDAGQVNIDADDSEHVIRIKHDLDNGVDILRAVDNTTSATTMRIDSNGDIHTGDVTFQSESGASRRVRQLDTILEAASNTDDGTESNLVIILRNQISNLTTQESQVVSI